MNHKSVLYIISGRSFSSKGLGRKISEVVKCWNARVERLDLVCGKDISGKSKDKVEYGNASFYSRAYVKKKKLAFFVHTMSEILDIFHDFKLYNYLRKKCKSKSYDLVVERSSRLHFSGLIFAKRRGIPYVLEWKDNLINYKFSIFKAFALLNEKVKLKYADFVIVESLVLKQLLLSESVPEKKIKVALNAVNIKEFQPSQYHRDNFRKNNNISPDRVVVCYMGSFAFYHNSPLLIKAVELLLRDKMDEPPLVLLIGNGKDFMKCKELANELDLNSEVVRFMSPVSMEQVPEVLSAVDISVLPGSTDIICPVKIFEYMAMATAVILPNYPCNKEAVSVDSGVFFEPNNVESLAQAIRLLVQDKELRYRKSEFARLECSERLSWESTWGSALDECFQKD
tara:strand:+ start:185 stop:1378 length:1194 start_codon:yes stop_codon:yes gene_type:complete